MIKALVGKGHEEFSTMRQQDAEEFLGHFFKLIRTDERKRGWDEHEGPTEPFRFGVEQRLQCGECKKVRYKVDSQDSLAIWLPAKEVTKMETGEGGEKEKEKDWEPVDLSECLQLFTRTEALEYQCPVCSKKVFAQKYALTSFSPDEALILG
jgi:ubiquitin carboxyl-terminal hydrolase 5/13